MTEEGRVLVEQRVELERVLGGDELVETDLAGRQRGPLTRTHVVVRVRAPVTDALEDHAGQHKVRVRWTSRARALLPPRGRGVPRRPVRQHTRWLAHPGHGLPASRRTPERLGSRRAGRRNWKPASP